MFKWLYGPTLISKSDRLGTYAAALAYCFVLSLIPFLVVTFTVGSQVAPGKLDLGGAYKDLLADILPGVETTRPGHASQAVDAPGEFSGLGIVVGMKNGSLEVLSVYKDSSAARAGLLPGDHILDINDKSTEKMPLDSVFKALKAPVGEKTRLTLLRPLKDYPAARNIFDVVLEPPRDLSAQIIATVQNTSHNGLATIGFILAFYTSFNLMEQIVRTLLFIFDDPRRVQQQWSWTVALKTFALLIIWMFLLFLISIVSVLTPVINNLMDQLQLNSALWTTPLLVIRDVLVLASVFGAFFLTYLLVPTKRPRLAQVRDGAMVASFGWILCSLLFAYVLPSLWHTNAVYKALGSVVIILLWAQACSWSVIVGACWIVRFPRRGK